MHARGWGVGRGEGRIKIIRKMSQRSTYAHDRSTGRPTDESNTQVNSEGNSAAKRGPGASPDVALSIERGRKEEGGRTEVPIQDRDGPLRILRSLDLPVT